MATIISISGSSASGKTSLALELLSFLPDSRMLLSLTTRTPRPSDIPGEYRYLSEEAFGALERDGKLLWSVKAHGNRYGTLKESASSAAERGTHIATLTIQAAEGMAVFLSSLETSYIPLYLRTSDENVLLERLRRRGDSLEDIRIRIEECRDWNERAAHSPVPFRVIDAALPLADMITEAKYHIEKAG